MPVFFLKREKIPSTFIKLQNEVDITDQISSIAEINEENELQIIIDDTFNLLKP